MAGGDTQKTAVKLAWQKIARPSVLGGCNWNGIKRTDRDTAKTAVKGRKITGHILGN